MGHDAEKIQANEPCQRHPALTPITQPGMLVTPYSVTKEGFPSWRNAQPQLTICCSCGNRNWARGIRIQDRRRELRTRDGLDALRVFSLFIAITQYKSLFCIPYSGWPNTEYDYAKPGSAACQSALSPRGEFPGRAH